MGIHAPRFHRLSGDGLSGRATGTGSHAQGGFLASIVGAETGFLFGLKTRERSVELKTYIRILKMADAITSRRLVLREGPRLRERREKGDIQVSSRAPWAPSQ